MAVAIVQEWKNATPGTRNYDAITEKLRSDGQHEPDGLLIHTAGFDGDTFRVFEVWESREQFERFRSDTLMPIIQSTASPDARPPEQHSYELHNVGTRGG